MDHRGYAVTARSGPGGRTPRGDTSMPRHPGDRLILAGLIVSFIGVCIVLVRVLRVPEYWVPLMAGVGLVLLGIIRRMTRGGGGGS
jgi:hypothetical protein